MLFLSSVFFFLLTHHILACSVAVESLQGDLKKLFCNSEIYIRWCQILLLCRTSCWRACCTNLRPHDSHIKHKQLSLGEFTLEAQANMQTGRTYSARGSRPLKHLLQATEWDVKLFNPPRSLRLLSGLWIICSHHLQPGGSTGNGARGHARHLLSISWLNFHCCRETLYPRLFPSDCRSEGKSIVKGESGREWDLAGETFYLRSSPGCSGTGYKEAGGERRREEKVHRRGLFFLSPLPCHYSHTEAYVNSHVGLGKQIEICQRSDDSAGGRKGGWLPGEKRGEKKWELKPSARFTRGSLTSLKPYLPWDVQLFYFYAEWNST